MRNRWPIGAVALGLTACFGCSLTEVRHVHEHVLVPLTAGQPAQLPGLPNWEIELQHGPEALVRIYSDRYQLSRSGPVADDQPLPTLSGTRWSPGVIRLHPNGDVYMAVSAPSDEDARFRSVKNR